MSEPTAPRHSGTVSRGALRPPGRPSSPSPSLRLGWIVVVAALVLAAGAVGWAIGAQGSGADASLGAELGSPSAAAGEPALQPTETRTQSPATSPATSSTSTPMQSPALRPTWGPTPAPSPTPRPTPRPTPASTAEPQPSPQLAELVIDFPVDGEVVGSRRLNVIGTAPPGSTVTRDIPFWFDEHTTAGDDGLWMMPVELAEGDNRLTFRIGDDGTTSQVIAVTYQPAP